MPRTFIQLFLTCSDIAQADNIAAVLLNEHLIACAKTAPVTSSFYWEEKINHDSEILLVMGSADDLFDEVDAKVSSLHSYDIINLQAITSSHVSKQTLSWLNETLKNGKQ